MTLRRTCDDGCGRSRILDQLDRIEAKLDRVLECVDVDDQKSPAKRRSVR